jgi:hypothetical protein
MNKHALLLAAALAATSAQAAGPAKVDFDNGMQGWYGDSAASGAYYGIDHSMGDGSTGYHAISPGLGYVLKNDSNPFFVGDYTGMKSFSFSMDITVNKLTNGNADGWPMTQELVLELRDYDKPGGEMPYSSVWIVMGMIGGYQPVNQHFAVTIPDSSSNLLPAGWHGNGDFNEWGEPTLPYGQTLRRVLSDVDQVVISTYRPGFLYGTEQWYDVTVDNIALSAVPEPEQYTMLAAGLGLLGFTARRRQRK